MRWIQGVALDPTLKISQFVLYSGQSWPLDHICQYNSIMGLETKDEAILCKAFPSTLSHKVLTLFTSLKLGAIDSWSALEKLFLDKFSTASTIPRTRGDLANIKQRDDESLLSYQDRF